jgi:hypothetical protein
MAGDSRRLALNVHKSSRSTVPTVHIFLQRIIRQENGMLAVTPVCSSLAEIEAEVAGLQGELHDILVQARQAYGPKRGPAISA